MKDELKQFVEENRSSFEREFAGLNDSWDEINARLVRQVDKNKQLRRYLAVAASFILICSFGFIYFLSSQQIKTVERDGIALYKVSEEMAETEAFYQEEITNKIKYIETEYGGLSPELEAVIDDLDEDYLLLKKDMSEGVSNEEVIQAMIGYYRMKLTLLEEVLIDIQSKDLINKGENDQESI